mgnify:CR=1 FL=1
MGVEELSVGEVARRSGVSVSALDFYEAKGLIHSLRTAGNQRRYSRDTLRRIAVIRVAQRVGMPLATIREALDTLPGSRAPPRADWVRLSAAWKDELEQRIANLSLMRDTLDQCIGCGCLSIDRCRLANPDDTWGEQGSGAQRWAAALQQAKPRRGGKRAE